MNEPARSSNWANWSTVHTSGSSGLTFANSTGPAIIGATSIETSNPSPVNRIESSRMGMGGMNVNPATNTPTPKAPQKMRANSEVEFDPVKVYPEAPSYGDTYSSPSRPGTVG